MSTITASQSPSLSAAHHHYSRAQEAQTATQKALATGKKVADAYDNGAAYAVAQSLTGQVGANDATETGLGRGQGLAQVTQAALVNLQDTSNDAQATLIKLSDSSLNATDRAAYTQQLNSQVQQLGSTVADASFNGANVLASGATNQNYVGNVNGGTSVSINATNVGSLVSTLTSTTTGSSAQAALAYIKTFQQGIGSAAQSVASSQHSIENQLSANRSQSDALATGSGAISDADLARGSTQSAQNSVQQQLAAYAINSISQQHAQQVGSISNSLA